MKKSNVFLIIKLKKKFKEHIFDSKEKSRLYYFF